MNWNETPTGWPGEDVFDYRSHVKDRTPRDWSHKGPIVRMSPTWRVTLYRDDDDRDARASEGINSYLGLVQEQPGRCWCLLCSDRFHPRHQPTCIAIVSFHSPADDGALQDEGTVCGICALCEAEQDHDALKQTIAAAAFDWSVSGDINQHRVFLFEPPSPDDLDDPAEPSTPLVPAIKTT